MDGVGYCGYLIQSRAWQTKPSGWTYDAVRIQWKRNEEQGHLDAPTTSVVVAVTKEEALSRAVANGEGVDRLSR